MIINWLLTRKCNLRCSYCAIVRDPVSDKYPTIKELIEKETTVEEKIETIKHLNRIYGKENLFHIFYGGEPFILFNQLVTLIDFCNSNNIYYTIITNATYPERIIGLYNKCGKLKGLTFSLDPIFFKNIEDDKDRNLKTNQAIDFIKLNEEKRITDDLVIETTIDNNNYVYLKKMLNFFLSKQWNIKVSVTAYDAPKNEFYDFSYYKDCISVISNYKISKDSPARDTLKEIYETDKYDNILHCKETLPMLIDYISSDFTECGLYNNTLTVDSDGKLRLCLRIRGVSLSNKQETLSEILKQCETKEDFEKHYNDAFSHDYLSYCKGCNWTCPMMETVSTCETFKNNIVHVTD